MAKYLSTVAALAAGALVVLSKPLGREYALVLRGEMDTTIYCVQHTWASCEVRR